MKSIKILALLFVSTFAFYACSDDDPIEEVNEEEVITTVEITLANSAGNVVLKSVDADGDGPGAAVITVTGDLQASTVYNGSIRLLNETESPAENITEEVEEEADEHQFFYAATNNLGTFAYSDQDGDGNPIGLEFTMTTGASGTTGNLTFILRHEPNKDGANVSAGDITNAGGSTDVDVTFRNVTIQ